ncbi:MAG TPA: DNA repair exonuclease [Nitrososphaerales archaeon]|nr:DNA repair exonuclease [Nitrososphaerales archaeon]
MPKFAHMSDIHIGAFRQPELKALLLDAFDASVDMCIREHVSFVVLAGDIFDSNIPDLSAVRRAAAKMKEAVDEGIRFYAIYGSHDFSPNYASIVDVLDGAGLFTKVEVRSAREGKTVLSFVQDPSGPKICGISGRKLSIDREEYGALDRESLEAEPGFKIFVFHGALDELKPSSLEMMESMPAACLPAGFQYYAGGHVHSRTVTNLPDHANVAYPGPLFATDFDELLQLARGNQRGFYIVDFDSDQVQKVEFIPVKTCEPVELHYSAQGKSSAQAANDLVLLASKADVSGKVVLLTVEGELREGKTSDIDFTMVRRRLLASNPLSVLSNYSRLVSKEMPKGVPPKPVRATEREVFASQVRSVTVEEPRLRGDNGVDLAVSLLGVLKEGRKENETRGDFEDRVSRSGLAVLGLQEES